MQCFGRYGHLCIKGSQEFSKTNSLQLFAKYKVVIEFEMKWFNNHTHWVSRTYVASMK